MKTVVDLIQKDELSDAQHTSQHTGFQGHRTAIRASRNYVDAQSPPLMRSSTMTSNLTKNVQLIKESNN
jgi:hypothetical protein